MLQAMSFIAMLIITLTGISLAKRRTKNITATREGVLVMNTRKISLIRIAAISFLLTIFWSASAFAQPQISSFSGSLTNKETLTVTGSGFGTKANASPFSWDDFEGGTNGVDLGNPVIGPKWTFLSAAPNPSYSNIRAHGGTTSAIVQWKNNPSGVSAFGWTGKGPFTQMYISFWRYMDPQDPETVPINHKILYVYPAEGTSGQDFMVGAVMSSWDNWRYAVQSNPTQGWVFPTSIPWGGDLYNWAHTIQKWQRWEVYVKMNDPPGTPNGVIHGYLDGQEVVNVTNANLTNIPAVWNDFRIGHLFEGYHPGGTDRSFFDDVYFDSTQARVEIGDAPTWAASTHREIQIPSAWSDTGTSITITLNQGSFANFNNAYLYVIDANGDVNTNGYLLSDGGGGGGTPPPSSGGDSSGGDSSSGGSGCGFVKDTNGKGKGAKGEGLAFAMMLIITLIGIALVKRIRFLNKILFFTIAILLFHFSIANAWTVNATWEKFAVGSTGGDQNLGQGDGLYNGNSRLSVVDTYFHSGKNSLRIFLPKGGPDWQHEFRLPSSITEGGEFWGRFYIYPPTGFDWTATPITKIFRTVVVDSANNGKGFISILAIKPDYYQCSAKSATPSVYGWIVGGAEMLSSEGFVCQNQASADDFLTPGQWHALELYIKVSSNGVGIFRIWHQGKLIWEKTGISNIPPAGKLWHGDGISANHFLGYWNGGVPQDQYLYIDDFTYTNQTPAQKDAVGNSMIGLIDWQSGGDSGGNTPPPSGGDTSSSGGGGCGFVKDTNGKGLKAKGEGLSFAIMLVIVLSGIALAKRASRLIKA